MRGLTKEQIQLIENLLMASTNVYEEIKHDPYLGPRLKQVEDIIDDILLTIQE